VAMLVFNIWFGAFPALIREKKLGSAPADSLVGKDDCLLCLTKLDGVAVDRRPSTAESPPIGEIRPFSKMTVTFEPLIGS
jgi:hypothetical protein